MTTFVSAYLIVWLAMTAYIGRLIARQRQLLRAIDRQDLTQCG